MHTTDDNTRILLYNFIFVKVIRSLLEEFSSMLSFLEICIQLSEVYPYGASIPESWKLDPIQTEVAPEHYSRHKSYS